MNNTEFISLFLDFSRLNNLEMNEATAEKFYLLCNCLQETNKIHNLTAIKEDRDIMLKHFIDSLLISQYIPENARVIDIGCGPGFPSLPIAIYRPDINVVGVDSTSKKINYVNETAQKLGLTNIKAISARAEDVAKTELRESFDFVTARAVASLPVLCELCLPFAKIGGTFLAMKAQNSDGEIKSSLRAIDKCGGEYYKTVFKKLCATDSSDAEADEKNETRSLIIVKKVKKTPEIYPRPYAKITKKPL
jgi:16S rRNA (guanine527-N7)-methyltransferase